MIRLDGAVVLVTGGARGVGAGIAGSFRAAGATVLICGRTPPAEATDGFLRCDVREPEQVTALVDEVVTRYGRLDVLVNNAGGSPSASAADASPRFSSAILGLNLLAPLNVSQVANRVMQRQDSGGAIVMVGSVSGARPSPGTAAYGAAKAGLANLGATLAVEWAPKVRVNTLVVGMVRTERADLHYGDAAGIASVGATVPLGRLAEPEEIGACAVFLASPLASYVTGAALEVHGGGERPAFLAAAAGQRDTADPSGGSASPGKGST